MSAHEENWVVFERDVDDAPTLMRVDLGWADEDHDGLSLPAVVEFVAPFKAPNLDAHGMVPPDDELDAFAALEDALVEAMGAAGGVLVAAIGTEHARRWVFYAPSVDAAGRALGSVANPQEYKLEAGGADDAAWAMYHDYFLPDDQEMAMIAHEGVFRALAESGDIPERQRPIEHLVYLPTKRAADEFAAWAQGEGFAIINRFKSEDAEEGLPPFGVEFSKVRPATMDEVMPDIDAATERAEGLEGFYDGWQTAPVTE